VPAKVAATVTADPAGQTYTLTTGIDTVTGTGNRDTIHATQATLTADLTGWTGVQTVRVANTGAAVPVTVTTASASNVVVKGGTRVKVTDTDGALKSVSLDGLTGEARLVGDGLTKVALANSRGPGAYIMIDNRTMDHAIELALHNATGRSLVWDPEATAFTMTVTGASDITPDFPIAETLAVKGTAVAAFDATRLSTLRTVTVSEAAGINTDLSSLSTLTSVDTLASTGTSTVRTHADVAYTGGAGRDSVTVVGAPTQAIGLGGGDDTVVLADGVGAGGSVEGGAGTDTLSVSAVQAVALAGSAGVSGFERLAIRGVTVPMTLDLARLGNIRHLAVADVTDRDAGRLTVTKSTCPRRVRCTTPSWMQPLAIGSGSPSTAAPRPSWRPRSPRMPGWGTRIT